VDCRAGGIETASRRQTSPRSPLRHRWRSVSQTPIFCSKNCRNGALLQDLHLAHPAQVEPGRLRL